MIITINNIAELEGKKIVTLAFGDKGNYPYVDCFVCAGIGHYGNDDRVEILAEDGHRTYMFQEEEKYGGDVNYFCISDYGRSINYAIVENGSYDFGTEELNEIFACNIKEDERINKLIAE